jgi:hypothetical protein
MNVDSGSHPVAHSASGSVQHKYDRVGCVVAGMQQVGKANGGDQ